MDSHLLETFLVVLEQGSLAAAARHLGLTPAAIAQRIDVLEKDVGAPLLMRAGRRVVPNQAGRAIVESSQKVLAEVRRLRSLARSDELAGELTLGAIATAMTGLVPDALARLQSEVPRLEVFLMPGTSRELHRNVVEGKLDAAIIVRPPFEIAKTLEWRRLRLEPLCLFCPHDTKGDDVLRILREAPFIRYDRSNWGGKQVDDWLNGNGLAPRDWLELDSLDAIAIMVGKGLGVSILPDWTRLWPENPKVRLLPLPGSRPREIGALCHRGSPVARLIEALLHTIAPHE
ncbi:LysR family transcriptional regulator [Aliihoeflea aestuarii]|jgi:DNA-binding transcriptional LysR family regulator|uniref:LysR family transcriptional regulator n=1 Tax=Aliihoeflea aestuarii TaxID=453840 RepID=UPI0020930C42|nr:LysR family transcriptional regulator [Aliihoeflea aestuarii]MCO6391824.1 LysR family transcriptional regulator [Aliihoeflea aestuarii]